MFRLISILLCTLVVLSQYSVMASDLSIEFKEIVLQDALQCYFDSRCVLNADQIISALDGIAEPGLINDELKRFDAVEDESVSAITNSYVLVSCSFYDDEGIAIVTENISYSVSDSTHNDTITHNITFGYTSDFSSFLILSDGYFEPLLEFKSCSYVSSSSVTNSMNSRTTTVDDGVSLTGDYAYDIVQVAVAELGYLEKDEATDNLDDKTADAGWGNYTKYGRWYGWNGDSWCSIFVAWCANQAGISTSVIPKNRYGRVREKKAFFIDENDEDNDLYYESFSQGGTYIPKIGDLFFTLNAATGQNHIGIVRSVSENEFITIEGNKQNQVLSRTMSFTDNMLVGFASPAYTTAESAHDYQCIDHSSSLAHTCKNCGKEATATLSCSHEGTKHQSICSLCNDTISAPYRLVYDATNHWKQCTICDNENWDIVLHALRPVNGGEYYVCRMCNYDSRVIVINKLPILIPSPLEGA